MENTHGSREDVEAGGKQWLQPHGFPDEKEGTVAPRTTASHTAHSHPLHRKAQRHRKAQKGIRPARLHGGKFIPEADKRHS